jgi:GT2 family glycosyltransferase
MDQASNANTYYMTRNHLIFLGTMLQVSGSSSPHSKFPSVSWVKFQPGRKKCINPKPSAVNVRQTFKQCVISSEANSAKWGQMSLENVSKFNPNSEKQWVEIPFVSVVCLTHNRKSKVLNLLQTLQLQSYQHYEVILIDNASTDGTREAVENLFSGVKIIPLNENLGMVAYNAGFQEARGEYILVIDDDAVPVSPDWITQIVSCFLANQLLGVVSCKIRMKDSGEVAPDNPEHNREGNDTKGYPCASYNGTGAGLRKEIFNQVSYYPQFFFRSMLEAYLCTRIIDAGWEVRYFPQIEVWHDRPTGSVNRVLTYYGMRNYFLYVWSLGPAGFPIFFETVRYAGFLYKSALKGIVSISLVTRSILDACWLVPKALKSRKPVSASTWEYLFQIRKGENESMIVLT